MDGDVLQVKELKQSAERERESEGGAAEEKSDLPRAVADG